ncbi:gfo/Idh/MocA family oxidoreductase [Paenibacillaceae bacterium]|nr:gfo/Idh/MocA family oxidoreductase [Paenibacillaceae bacterium]
MSKLRIGMISLAHGHGFSYLHQLLGNSAVELIGIADEHKPRVQHVLEQHNLPFYADYRDLLALKPDAVVICSENSRHAEHVIAAAQAKAHVLCEKPLGIDVAEMEKMIEVCQENGVQLMTAFPCRYLAAVAQAKQAVDAGEIGSIVAIKGTNRGSLPPGWFLDKSLSGGGALLDHTVHVMDLMNWFTGSTVKEVYAYAATLFHRELDIDDSGMIHVKFDNGVFGVLDTSWSRNSSFPTWGDVTMEIIGTNGVIAIDGLGQVNEVFSEEHGKATWAYWGDNMDEHMVGAFVDALVTQQPVPISGEDGLRSAAVALAGYASVASGQPVNMSKA